MISIITKYNTKPNLSKRLQLEKAIF